MLAVKASRKWARETRIQFSIRDTGVGIPAEDQSRILEPFTQVGASSTRRFGGTGLGLAICNELVQLMGGRMTVKSEVGVGSNFSFQLTFTRPDEPNKDSVEYTPLEQLKNMRVLVVDDNETNCRIVAETLSNWSMQPDTANDGQQALSQLEIASANGSPYPLVIVDALMPSMDGYVLSEEIAKMSADPPPVILMLSSSDRREFRQREKHAGVATYLQKPVSQSDLMDAVMRALNVQATSGDDDGNTFPAKPNFSLSILLAEDTPANQKVVTSILKKRGHTVTVAQNGREAVELFGKQAFDVVLMDVQMPIMDGHQATAAIREQEKDSGDWVPIVAMTAHPGDEYLDRCVEAGMNGYLAKPLDAEELLQMLRKCAAEAAGGGKQEEVPSAQPIQDRLNRRLDPETSRALMQHFVQDLEGWATGLPGLDAAAQGQLAHAIKGAALNLGFDDLAEAAGSLEKGQAGTDTAQALAYLQQVMRSTRDELEVELGTDQPS